MGLLTEVGNVLTGGLGSAIVDGIKAYFPPSMSEEQKANLSLAVENIALQKTIEANKALNDAEKSLNERIAMYEGSASDLKAIPVLGAIMLFIRGAQRPVWGMATLFIDYQVFGGMWKLDNNMTQNSFWVVNFLVLGFLFGERAIMNVMPFFIEMTKVKQGTAS